MLPYMVLQDLRTYLAKKKSLYVLCFPAEDGEDKTIIPRDVTSVISWCLCKLCDPFLAFQTYSVWISNCKRNGVSVRKNDTTSRFGSAELHVFVDVINRFKLLVFDWF